MSIPIINEYTKRIYLLRFTSAMSLLSDAKLSITESLALSKDMVDFEPIKVSIDSIGKDLVQGVPMSIAFAKFPKLYDKKFGALIKVAEQTNQLELIFENLKERYETLVEQQSLLLKSTINPILTLFVGIVIGLILIAMYLPMFQLSTVLS